MEHSFDFWSILFSIAAAQGVFLSVLLFVRKSKTNNLLAYLILSFSICLGYYVVFWTGYFRQLPWQIGALQGLTFLFGPLAWFYIKSDKKTTHVQWSHVVPFVFYVVYFVTDTPPRVIKFPLLPIAQTAHLIIYSVLIFNWLTRNKGYHNGALKRYTWQRKVAWAFAGYVMSFLAYYVLVWTNMLKIEYDYMISLASSFFIYFIGYHGFQKQEVLRMNEEAKYDKSSLTASAGLSILKRLNELMESRKLYRESSLKLKDVADHMELTPHHVSQVINALEEKNFSDYVNEFRISEAKKLLIESNYKIISIAYDSGFNNKTSFNSAFKKSTGMSPKEYRELHLTVV